jgi:hypothetical protein
MKRNLKKIPLDLSRTVCNHLVGSNHTIRHRVIAGIIIMIFGVGIVYLSKMIEAHTAHFVGEVVGFFFHGWGAVPIIEAINNSEHE